MTWIILHSGRAFDLLNPRADMINPLDIAHALAHTCRFNGHCTRHYSVAQHSMLVAELVPAEDQLHALLHDATEAFVGDMVRPLKHLPAMSAYREIEQRIWLAICQQFHLVPELPESVKQADMVALATERRDLMPDHPSEWECLRGVRPSSHTIATWSPTFARQAYYDRLLELLATTHRARATA